MPKGSFFPENPLLERALKRRLRKVDVLKKKGTSPSFRGKASKDTTLRAKKRRSPGKLQNLPSAHGLKENNAPGKKRKNKPGREILAPSTGVKRPSNAEPYPNWEKGRLQRTLLKNAKHERRGPENASGARDGQSVQIFCRRSFCEKGVRGGGGMVALKRPGKNLREREPVFGFSRSMERRRSFKIWCEKTNLDSSVNEPKIGKGVRPTTLG